MAGEEVSFPTPEQRLLNLQVGNVDARPPVPCVPVPVSMNVACHGPRLFDFIRSAHHCSPLTPPHTDTNDRRRGATARRGSRPTSTSPRLRFTTSCTAPIPHLRRSA